MNLHKNSIIKLPFFWIVVWLVLLTLNVIAFKYNFYQKEINYGISILQLIIDIAIASFGYLAYRNQIDKKSKKFYFFILISLIPGLFANEVYNVLINVIGIKEITKQISIYWTIAYAAFLVIQIGSWSYLLVTYTKKSKINNSWLYKLPYFPPAIAIMLSLISIKLFRSNILSEVGFTGILNSTLEVILFFVLSMALSRTKNKSLIYLEVGFLLLIAFNLVHRFSYSTGYFFKALDVAWIIALIIIIAGLALASQEKIRQEKIEFFENNSIHVVTSTFFITFSTAILVFFAIIQFLISSSRLGGVETLKILIQNIPTALIFSYTLSLLTGKLIANKSSLALDKISKRIKIAYENKPGADQQLKEKLQIIELERLDKFILKTLTELQIANRVKSEFLMNMSHDFRTPASGIHAMSSSIYKKMQNPDLKKLQKLVVDSSGQLINFLEDILDHSRLERKQHKLELNEIDIYSLANEVVLFLSAKAAEKKLILDAEFLIATRKYYCDELAIRRILLNLMSNAIKFTHQGQVKLLVEEESVENKKFLKLTIIDTGIGIDKQYHEKIFEPFFRVSSTDSGKYPGIGLGLSNVLHLVKLLDGKISLKSHIAKGTEFIVHIPVNAGVNL